MHCIDVAQSRSWKWELVNVIMKLKGCIKCEDFLDKQINGLLLDKCCMYLVSQAASRHTDKDALL
jgi:hypothetical protein